MAWHELRVHGQAAYPSGRECHVFSPVGHKLYLFGGNNNTTRFSGMSMFDAGM